MSASAVDAPLITWEPTNSSVCGACGVCAALCPVQAIHADGARIEIVTGRCVACGVCVAACPEDALRVRDDVPLVEGLLRSGRPVVALLATEYLAALHPLTPPQIERALMTLGFCSVETTVLGEESVAAAYDALHARADALLTIRSTCPVAVDFVRMYHPGFVAGLAPLVPPYIAQARLIKDLYEGDVAVVYVSPCYARKDEWRDPQFGGAVDAVIDFLELRRMFEAPSSCVVRPSDTTRLPARPRIRKQMAMTDGYPRAVFDASSNSDGSVRVVRGLGEIDALLGAMASGETAPAIIDMLSCPSCIDGPAVSPCLSAFAKRNVETGAVARMADPGVGSRALLSVLPRPGLVRSFSPKVAPPAGERMVSEVMRAGVPEPHSEECGDPASVLRPDESLVRCLTREIARVERYGGDLSIVLLALDGVQASADTIGSRAADTLLGLVEVQAAASLRLTDRVGRWRGGRLALILPGIGKTAAFAVAEKLRALVAGTSFRLDASGYREDVRVTLSAGVVSAAGGRGPDDLMSAAGAALDAAVSQGGDRVHLASG